MSMLDKDSATLPLFHYPRYILFYNDYSHLESFKELRDKQLEELLYIPEPADATSIGTTAQSEVHLES